MNRVSLTSQSASKVPPHGGLRTTPCHTPKGLDTRGGTWQQPEQGSIFREESTPSQWLLDLSKEGWAIFLEFTRDTPGMQRNHPEDVEGNRSLAFTKQD